MDELLDGLLHWTTFHDGIRSRVSSYYVEPAGLVIDPRVPEEGLEAFDGRPRPQQVLLTSGHHARHAERFAEAFGALIRISPEALRRPEVRFEADTEIYTDHDEVAPGVHAIHIGKLSEDEYAFHIEIGEGAISFADGLIRPRGVLGFVPDELMGAHPDRVKAGLKDAFRGLLTRDFDHLLFAHGEPLVHGGKAALREFLERPVGYPEYGQVL